MSTLQSAGGFSRIKDQSEAEEGSSANWPSDGATFGLLIAISVTCFVLIGGGLGVVSWHVIEERGRENQTSALASNNHNRHQGDGRSVTGDDDRRIVYWPVLTGNTSSTITSNCRYIGVNGVWMPVF